MDLEKFGKFMFEQRSIKAMTQEQVGNILGVTDKAVSRWERGECYPEITQLPKIAKMFAISVDELLNCEAKPAKLLKMCGHCKNQKCKKNNYSMLPHCANSFHWGVYGIGVAAFFILFIVAYLIVRIVDGNWTEWKFPLILGLVYISIAAIASLVFSLKDIKIEIKDNSNNDKSTQ